jgi:hypothetical protein
VERSDLGFVAFKAFSLKKNGLSSQRSKKLQLCTPRSEGGGGTPLFAEQKVGSPSHFFTNPFPKQKTTFCQG